MLDITGEVRVFANEIEVGKGKKKETKTVYNCQIGSRCIDPEAKKKEWMNCYVGVNFSKALEEDAKDGWVSKTNGDNDSTYIDLIVRDAWFTCYKDKDDKVRPILFINKAKVVK